MAQSQAGFSWLEALVYKLKHAQESPEELANNVKPWAAPPEILNQQSQGEFSFLTNTLGNPEAGNSWTTF